MNAKDLRKFFLGIVLPSILAITLFILSFYVIIIPSFEKNMMESKKEMISELTNSAWSLVDEYYNEYRAGHIRREEAMQLAASRIGKMRYGDEKKDYFWITDMRPFMVMHPYRQELNGTDLSDYKDPQGKRLFVDAAEIVSLKGEGYIDYIWQWKDDTTLIGPKLSYVKGFPQWEWIIGTGIYLEDVKQEIKMLERNLFRISIIIVIVIASTLLYIIRQSMIIENRRKEVAHKLRLSRQKYLTLVESSTIGTLMMAENKIIYANQKFLNLSGFLRNDMIDSRIEDLFDLDWHSITDAFKDPGKSVSMETRIKSEVDHIQVLLSVSKVIYNNVNSYIIVINELSRSAVIDRHSRVLQDDLQSALLLMNQPIAPLVRDYLSCDLDGTISEAANLLKRKNREALLIKQKGLILGIVTASDFLNRAMSEGIELNAPVSTIMSAPVVSVPENCLLHEAIYRSRLHGISYLQVNNRQGECIGLLEYKNLLEVQQNCITQLFDETDKAESVSDLRDIYLRMNAMIELLVCSGSKPGNITRLVSAFSDQVNVRIVKMAIEKEGTAPCDFCFIAMGSQGRMEQTLSTDQDNGIIINDSLENDETATFYFRRLGERIAADLNTVGYRFCKGNIMASNPQWIKSLKEWKKQFSFWINNSDPQSLMEVNIFFDFRAIYGDSNLSDELRTHLNRAADGKAVFFYHFSQEITRFKPPVGLFGKILGEHESPDSNLVDIKKLLMPVAGFARLYALRALITETNTLNRFEGLRDSREMPDVLIDEITEAYNILMGARLRSQVNCIVKGEDPSNILDVNQLTNIEQTTIRKVLSVLSDLVTKVKLDFEQI
ncbi:MAG: cache domain-containing protein [Bacteroidales bacterium]|nr:cache domain-containing protein [Bacteroidales bacterium]